MALTSLAGLLLGQAYNQMAQPEDQPDGVAPIVVTPTQADPSAPAYDPYVDNRIQPADNYNEEIIPRKGMFGVKGTLRDVIGTLGDAFLMNRGQDARYQPYREQEKLGDAMSGFTQGGEETLQAIERVAARDPALAQKLMQQYQTSQYQKAQSQSLGANRESQIQARRDKQLVDTRNWGARILQGAGDNPTLQGRALAMIQQQAQRLGLSMEDLGLPTGMTPEELQMFSRGDMTAYQQQQLPISQQRADTGSQNADTAARRAATQERQGNTRLGIQQQNADTSAQRANTYEQAREDRAAGSGRRGSGRRDSGSNITIERGQNGKFVIR